MNRITAITIAWTTKEYIKNLLRINARNEEPCGKDRRVS